MRLFKKKFYAFCLLIALAVPVAAVPATVQAVDVFQPCSSNAARTDVCKDARATGNRNPLLALLKTVLIILSIVVGIAAVIMMIVNGLRMVISQGDPGAFKTAREGIIYALAGLAIVAVAQAIVAFVLNAV